MDIKPLSFDEFCENRELKPQHHYSETKESKLVEK
jgi:hypothetical protein